MHAVTTRTTHNTAQTQLVEAAGHLMAGLIPDAQIRIYPDAAHGFLFQYPTEVAAEVNTFLA
jgi:pimeloyl-ACP methyl ester carboxylesterase